MIYYKNKVNFRMKEQALFRKYCTYYLTESTTESVRLVKSKLLNKF